MIYKNGCWDEINLGAYSSWHVWSTRRLRSSSNPWSLVILQVTWSVEKQLTWVSLLLETFEWKSNKGKPTSCWPWMQMERDLAKSHPPHTWLVKDHKKEHRSRICSFSPRSRAQWTSGHTRSTWRCLCCSRAGRLNDPRKLRSSCTVLLKKKVSQP